MLGTALLLILVMSLAAFYIGRRAALGFDGVASEMHSLPGYHGAFVAVWVGIPAFVLVLAWVLLQDAAINRLLIASLPSAMTEGATTSDISLLISEIRNVAAGRPPRPPTLSAGLKSHTGRCWSSRLQSCCWPCSLRGRAWRRASAPATASST